MGMPGLFPALDLVHAIPVILNIRIPTYHVKFYPPFKKQLIPPCPLEIFISSEKALS